MLDGHLVLRRLEAADVEKGFMKCLAQLTKAPEVDSKVFTEQLHAREQQGCHTVVIEDSSTQQVVGTASLLIERKFIWGCSKAGHIEDVVVDSRYRGHHLGQRLIDELVSMACSYGCYKIILDCARSNMEFYNKCGFEEKGVEMAKYITS
ncbi:hypothetical protein WJX74_008068 [Apatococcus lobatus]|uniref:Glucosamine 6-phosphate N-acetyltransferase n=1 Tax=Apatococcus lobatus TaxID=904363 RepID=A0AAW1S426_9CHLO